MEHITDNYTFGLVVLFALAFGVDWVLKWLIKYQNGESKNPPKNDAPPAQKIQIFINCGQGSGRPNADRSDSAQLKRS